MRDYGEGSTKTAILLTDLLTNLAKHARFRPHQPDRSSTRNQQGRAGTAYDGSRRIARPALKPLGPSRDVWVRNPPRAPISRASRSGERLGRAQIGFGFQSPPIDSVLVELLWSIA